MLLGWVGRGGVVCAMMEFEASVQQERAMLQHEREVMGGGWEGGITSEHRWSYRRGKMWRKPNPEQ